MKIPIFLALMCLLTAGNVAMFAQQPVDVSMVKLIAFPDTLDGKLVRVSGFLKIEFEGMELYLHKEDCTQGLTKNGVWLELDREARGKYGSMNMHYVFIEGIVDSKHFGHMGATSATLIKIQRVELVH